MKTPLQAPQNAVDAQSATVPAETRERAPEPSLAEYNPQRDVVRRLRKVYGRE